MRSIFHISFFLLLLGASSGVVSAQEITISARVSYVSGKNVYLDAGRDQNVQPGDSLLVFDGDRFAGRLVINSSIASRSVATYVGDPFALTVGLSYRIQIPKSVNEPNAADLAAPPATDERAPARPSENAALTALGSPTGANRNRGRQPHVSGRLLFSLSALQSNTKWGIGNAQSRSRSFTTPSANLNLNITGLPGDVKLLTRIRADYRYSSGQLIEPTMSIRMYDIVLEKDIAQATIQAGRFSNRYTPFGGYWDGALVHFGGTRSGIGTAIGFVPVRTDEQFSSDMPRYSGFAHFETGRRTSTNYSARISFDEIRPTTNLLNHRFAGLSHSLRFPGVRIRNDIQLDQDPISRHWITSRFVTRMAVNPADRISIYGEYSLRQPYSIYRMQQIFSYRRDRASGGLSLQFSKAMIGADIALNFVDDGSGGHRDDGRTVSGYVQLPNTGLMNLGYSVMTSYWSHEDGSSLYVNTGVSRRIGSANTRLQYQFHQTEINAGPVRSHALAIQVSLPLGRNFYTSSRLRLQTSSTVSNLNFFTSLSYSF